MNGLKVKCPNCTRISFETTDQFNPDVPPHGGMVKCLLPYQIDWLCSSTTLAAEMTCPECLAPLVIGGILNVVIPIREAGEVLKEEKPWETPVGNGAGANEAIGESPALKSVPDIKAKIAIDKFICDVCGKTCKTKLALAGHMRSHKEK